MVKMELGQVVIRRMKEEDIELVKELIKEGCQGTENRLLLHLLTRPLCLLLLATISSVLRCLLHSFLLAMMIPVFLLIVYLKITMPRSIGVLGTSQSCWDYVGSSYRGEQDTSLPNIYSRISGKPLANKKVKRRKSKSKSKEETESGESIDPERERVAGHVWLADWDGELVGCAFREAERRHGIRRICRVVVGCWYRREGLGRLIVQSLEQRERETGGRRIYAHVPYPSKMAEAFFRKLGYRLQGEGTYGEEEEEEEKLEKPETGLFGFQVTKVFFKDL